MVSGIFLKHHSMPVQQAMTRPNQRPRTNSRRPQKTPTAQAQPQADLGSFEFVVHSLSHEGRGVALYTADASLQSPQSPQSPHPTAKHGKKVFIRHALAGETVRARVTHAAARFDEAELLEVIQPSPDRVQPPCPHVAYCGGCSLQHLQVDAQLAHKQSVLSSHLQHFASIQPQTWLPPIQNQRLDYRRRARVSVRYLPKQQRLVVGFRAAASNQIQPISDCAVLDQDLNQLLKQLPALLAQMADPSAIGHIELAKGDDACAVLLRHTASLTTADVTLLRAWAASQSCVLYLQGNQAAPKRLSDVQFNHSNATSTSLHQKQSAVGEAALNYRLTEFGLDFAFAPTDFTQVNAAVNAQMVQLACELLELKSGQRVLDLFCGLGNFSLPMAQQVTATGLVVGVEGSSEMVARARYNAARNALNNTAFYVHDLTQPLHNAAWAQQQFDAILIDPPRAGAVEMLASIVQFAATKIVYVSCDPATLARDAGFLQQHGYTLTKAGIMDMFSHTSHVESIALFEKQTTPIDTSMLALTKGDGHGHRA